MLLRFAAAYGFRNIQNMVLKLKRGKFPYHFVEVLACAGGEARPRPAPPLAPPQRPRGVRTRHSLCPAHPPGGKGVGPAMSPESPLGEGVPGQSHGIGDTR